MDRQVVLNLISCIRNNSYDNEKADIFDSLEKMRENMHFETW